MTKSNSDRQREYHKRMLDAGFKKIYVYVPSWTVEKLRAYAEKLRNMYVRK